MAELEIVYACAACGRVAQCIREVDDVLAALAALDQHPWRPGGWVEVHEGRGHRTWYCSIRCARAAGDHAAPGPAAGTPAAGTPAPAAGATVCGHRVRRRPRGRDGGEGLARPEP